MNRFAKLLCLLSLFFYPASYALAYCTGRGDCCACPGQAQDLGSHSSCEEACGLTSNRGNSSPSYDYGAARRAQEAAEANAAAERQRQQAETERIERERVRQAEEKRVKDAQFIRDRDSAANSLKGSSGSAMNQLKGLSDTDNSGLKGSGFDTGGTGLKGLSGSISVSEADKSAKDAKSSAYSKGFEHASNCISQNSGSACVGLSADKQQTCVADYRAGYDSGSILKKLTLDEAYEAGKGAATRGERANAISDKRAAGQCRVEWIQFYNRGYFKGKHAN